MYHNIHYKYNTYTLTEPHHWHSAQDLSVSVGYSYSEDQFMHFFLDNFHQCGNYTAHIFQLDIVILRINLFVFSWIPFTKVEIKLHIFQSNRHS